MSERSGIEIDYCPECRGVWLDRGELDKIIDHAQLVPHTQPMQQTPTPTQYAHPTPPASPQPPYGRQQYPYKKKRENWLSELFD
jgi:Zn-finger nucleic acid-binding protein